MTKHWPNGIMSSPEVQQQQRDFNIELRKAVEKVKSMSPEELEAMEKAQRLSWTRQDND